MPSPNGVLEFLGLESCAERISGCGCIVRTYGNLVGGAMCITIVIVAILHVTLNALNMLTAAILLFLHFHFSFPLAVLCKRRCSFAEISLSAKVYIYSF